MKKILQLLPAAIIFLLSPFLISAQGPVAPTLGTAACYAILSGNGAVSNTGITHVTGDVGTNLGSTLGYLPMHVNGTIHPGPDASTAQATLDLVSAFNYLNALTPDEVIADPAQFGNNVILTPKTYLSGSATTLSGNLFLNAQGNSNAVFVIQINGALTTGTTAKVILMNGAQSNNIYWSVAGAVTLSTNVVFHGTIIVNNAAINLAAGDSLYGRALTTNGAIGTTDATVISPEVTCLPQPGSLTISGIVHNDTDGLTDGEVNGNGTNAGDLNAILVDNSGFVAGSASVSTLGLFKFFNVLPGTYRVQLSTSTGIVGELPPAIILPARWVSTGEFKGTGAGNDGDPNSIIPDIEVVAANVSDLHLGIEERPIAGNGANSAGNPGGTLQVSVPGNTFTNGNGIILNPSTDAAPGTVTKIRITGFPGNTTSMVINGTSYSSLNPFPLEGVIVNTDANGAPPNNAITVDPAGAGNIIITIPFKAIDNAGVESSNTGTAVLNLLPVPDLTPRITLIPQITYGQQVFEVSIAVSEINAFATNGSVITCRIPKNAALIGNPVFDAGQTTNENGETINNTIWTFDNTNTGFFVFRTTQVMPANGRFRFAFKITITPGASIGKIPFTVLLGGNSGGEVNNNNNSDDEVLSYFEGEF